MSLKIIHVIKAPALFLFLTTFSIGCGSTMINAPNTRSNYAPVNESHRAGTVKYLNAGANFVIKRRREDAYKQMWTSCGGKYKIIAEGPREEGGVVTVTRDSASSATINSAAWEYWHIQFQCIE